MENAGFDAPDGARTLNGWKEIAGYLGKSVRSVQRWEEQLGLPVSRIQTPKGQIVYANRAAIDEWRRRMAPEERDAVNDNDAEDGTDGQAGSLSADDSARVGDPPDQPTSPPLWQRRSTWLSVLALIILLALGASALSRFGAPRVQAVPFRVTLTGRVLQALDKDGVVLWTHRFSRDVWVIDRDESGGELSFRSIVDTDGDGVDEILVPLRGSAAGDVATSAESDALYCFDAAGELKWAVSADQTVTFNGRSFGAPWEINDFVVSDTIPRRIWVAWQHHTWWPGMVTEITPDGRSRTIHIQSGRVYALTPWETPAGAMLAVGGISQASQSAVIALLAIGGAPSYFTESPAPEYRCDNCGTNTPRRAYVFDRLDLSAVNSGRHPYVKNLEVVGVDLKTDLFEGGSAASHGGSIVRIGPDFDVESVELADSFATAHRDWERRSDLDHAYDVCPERQRVRTVRTWTPDRGWGIVSIGPNPH
jgi:hypothetical protein